MREQHFGQLDLNQSCIKTVLHYCGRVRNVPNQVVRGDDFFDRQDLTERVFELARTGSVLLHGPRRMGKTSLLRKLEDLAPERNYATVAYVDVEDARTELEFLHELHRSLPEAAKGPIWKRLVGGPLKRFLKAGEVEGLGIRIAFSATGADAWREVGAELIDAIRATPGRTLILLDELSVFLLHGFLTSGSEGRERAHTFLSWLRRHWQAGGGSGEPITWIFSGSIGLPMLFDRYRLGDTLGGLSLVEVPAFERQTSRDLVSCLLRADNVRLEAETAVVEEILDRIGWMCPQHLQHFVSVLYDTVREDHGADRVVRTRDIDTAWERMLSAANRPVFDWWSQRLNEEMNVPTAALARELLCACAPVPTGVPLEVLLARVMASQPALERRGEVLSLLDVLEHDGYLVHEQARYRFRSNILREYWQRRHAR